MSLLRQTLWFLFFPPSCPDFHVLPFTIFLIASVFHFFFYLLDRPFSIGIGPCPSLCSFPSIKSLAATFSPFPLPFLNPFLPSSTSVAHCSPVTHLIPHSPRKHASLHAQRRGPRGPRRSGYCPPR
ncbi:hypothetical protein M011DRAFT_319691 [Sporormia fimetaria CBS 119925]|uniref:Uncharacterized protein n=1 Tax=Sporormia fimetaria CBS 119925 TaxID=1340428 RepID=A0A6A6VGM2_9PLEO|nr:hypothetical protein M011DRAFT_319691 [Sporormia fimetaria CBS 119925]